MADSLEVRNVNKTLGGNRVVNGVSFGVATGEFFVLLGASGSGKSTLLRLICGLETPDAGEVWIAGRDVTTLAPRERNIGMVFQDYGLYPNMDVFANIAYGLEARRLPRTEIDARVTTAADKLGLTSLLRRAIVDLSGGEQQRVALARALARDADVYLFDEPLSNLDPKLRYQARLNIMLLHREKSQPTVYVTHDQAEAIAIADRIGVMIDGRLEQTGSADELLHSPINTRVARFIGSPPMNLLPGQLVQRGDELIVQGDGFALLLTGEGKHKMAQRNRSAVIVGLRPDAFALVGSRAADDLPDASRLTVSISDVEMLIGETILTFALGPIRPCYAQIEDDGAVDLTPGATVDLCFDPNRLLFFDPDSTEAL